MEDTTVQDPLGAGPPPSPAPRRLLRREGGEEKFAGVCAGVADYLSVDVTLVRIAAVFLAFAGPGIPAYVIAWIVMPTAPAGTPPSPVRHGPILEDGMNPVAGVALLLAAAFVVFDGGLFGRDVVWPMLLIGAGVWLLVRDRSEGPGADGPPRSQATASTTAPPPSTSPPMTSASMTSAPLTAPPSASGQLVPAGTGTARLTAPPTSTPADATPGGPRSAVGRVVLGLLALGGSLLWVLDVADVIEISFTDGLAIALVGVGLGLVAASLAGGARWLIAPALLIVLALTLARAVDVPLDGGFGERDHAPQAVADVRDAYRLTAGEMVLDLRQLELGGERLAVAASIGAGSLQVLLPDDVAAEISSSVAVGELVAPGVVRDRGALGIDEDISLDGREGAGTLLLDLEVGIGEVEVTRG